MTENTLITLTSDFGLQDGYVGIIKGVIAQITPSARTIDINHQISPQDIHAGRFILMNAYNYFPKGTIHLAVIDPGVGGKRRGVGIRFAAGYVVGPDNGLFSGILSQSPAISAVNLNNPAYWRTAHPSTTFHGRDIFAPVAAYLAQGVPLEMFGEIIDPSSLVQLAIAPPVIREDKIIGQIQYIDIFGNLITNISDHLLQGKNWFVQLGQKIIPAQNTYSDVPLGEIVAFIGSHGGLEIAVNSGNAQEQLRLNIGAPITVIINRQNVMALDQ
jgi:S-adenosyl-L-methionine hydrolase (adenosine-forming)